MFWAAFKSAAVGVVVVISAASTSARHWKPHVHDHEIVTTTTTNHNRQSSFTQENDTGSSYHGSTCHILQEDTNNETDNDDDGDNDIQQARSGLCIANPFNDSYPWDSHGNHESMICDALPVDDAIVTTTNATTATTTTTTAMSYSVHDDASWPIMNERNRSDTTMQHVFSENRYDLYQSFMQQCQYHHPIQNACYQEEFFRMQRNMYQPGSVRNYTTVGFWKTHVPPTLLNNILIPFWQQHHHSAVIERTYPSSYHNNWHVPLTMVRLGNRSLTTSTTTTTTTTTMNDRDNPEQQQQRRLDVVPGVGGRAFEAMIARTIQPIIETWTGMRQAITSVYGIRIYHNQSILAPHVDRLPLVASAIINVAQNVDEDWPLEIYDHSGIAHNVTMKPGDMILYESHSVIHGRPFALQGQYYANIFVHFEPYASLIIDDDESTVPQNKNDNGVAATTTTTATTTATTTNHPNNKNNRDDLPPYLLLDSSWEPEWREEHPQGWILLQDLRLMVEKGDLATFQYVWNQNPELHQSSSLSSPGGWTMLHEAVKHGHENIMIYLVEQQGVPINTVAQTRHTGTPLAVAYHFWGQHHPIAQYLIYHGAKLVP